MFEIEKDFPLPPNVGKKGCPRKYPFDKMDVGNSFVVGHSRRDAHNVRAATRYYYKIPSGKGKRFSVQRGEDNVWRCYRYK
jgi:hypothetical protein